MPNSQSNFKKLLNKLAWWLGFAARFLPGPAKAWALLASTLLGAVVAVMNNCDAETKQQAKPAPTSSSRSNPPVYETRVPSNDAWGF